MQPEKTTRGLKAEAAKVLADKRKAEAGELKAAYKALETNDAFIDLMKKVRGFAAYHVKIAKDGVGFEDVTRTKSDGTKVVEPEKVKLTGEQQLFELKKAAGIEEILDYVDRLLA